jgi:RimJ/RimL family protein N-acetyltransferase
MLSMPVLETERLKVRPLAMRDLEAVHRILDVELGFADGDTPVSSPEERRRWLEWTVLNYEQLGKLYQPPYGERAVELKSSGALLGTVGFVPCLSPFSLIPALRVKDGNDPARLNTTEFGMFWALSPAHQGRGYATEAAGAMIRYAFGSLGLRRIVATTEYDNERSMKVMQRLGMQIERNPFPDPPWFQVVGVLWNQSA